jgi:hypothetical protein
MLVLLSRLVGTGDREYCAPALFKGEHHAIPHLDPLYSRAEIGILACAKCGNPIRLSQIEPAAPGVMMCARSNARSVIPASAFRSLSERDFYAVLE